MAVDGQETEASEKAFDLEIGAIVKGKVVSVDEKTVTLDIGASVQAIIPIRELSVLHINHPSEVVAVGDEVEACVVKVDKETGVYVLSKRQAGAQNAWTELMRKFENGETFEVQIHDAVKGGLVADVGVRAFLPASLVDRHFIDDISVFKGQTVKVKISEIDPANQKLILSRKAVLEDEQHAAAFARIQSLEPGMVISGTVQRLTQFGAFVDLGGVDGLVHISEMARHRIHDPAEIVSAGDTVDVKVLRVDAENGRVSLSMKDVAPDPWDHAADQFTEGAVVAGTVRRLVDFGAFVELAPGIEGLVHVSQIANQRIAKPSDVLQVGQEVRVKILGVDLERRRISLSMKDSTRETSRKDVQSYMAEQGGESGTGAKIGDLFADWFKKS